MAAQQGRLQRRSLFLDLVVQRSDARRLVCNHPFGPRELRWSGPPEERSLDTREKSLQTESVVNPVLDQRRLPLAAQSVLALRYCH